MSEASIDRFPMADKDDGSYIEFVYLTRDRRFATRATAEIIMVRECDKDGNLIREHHAVRDTGPK